MCVCAYDDTHINGCDWQNVICMLKSDDSALRLNMAGWYAEQRRSARLPLRPISAQGDEDTGASVPIEHTHSSQEYERVACRAMTCFVEFVCVVLCPNAGIFQVFNLFEFFVLKKSFEFRKIFKRFLSLS